jgi:hypothetical protein
VLNSLTGKQISNSRSHEEDGCDGQSEDQYCRSFSTIRRHDNSWAAETASSRNKGEQTSNSY